MCKQCLKPNSDTTAKSPARYRIWELPRHLHCPVIGTCLSMEELRKIERQCDLGLPPGSSDYQLHAHLVAQVEHSGPIARRVQKRLDRKYARWIGAYGRLQCDQERAAFWRQARQSGDLPGPFWALATHPATERSLFDRTQGDVHMLSHLQGAANRADLRENAVLKQHVDQLQQELEHQRIKQLHRQQRFQERLNAQERSLLALRQQRSHAESSAADLGPQLQEARKRGQLLSNRLAWTEQQLARQEMRVQELEHGRQRLIEQLQELRQERDQLRHAHSAQPTPATQTHPLDLKGWHLAYVGGRASLYPRLRALVEAHNGQLSHHDGGREDNRAELCQSLAGADCVFCPVDCVSHDACLRIKRFCKKHNKPFVPLRSASLSAFTQELQQRHTLIPTDSPT